MRQLYFTVIISIYSLFLSQKEQMFAIYNG